jgi:uncharacterized phiE125 gp8 family phage protein
MNKYNHIHDVIDVSTDSTPTEPVTVQEAKDWMRLEGFIDTDDSTASDFDDDDTIIEMLIVSARKRLEEYTGLSFIPKTFEAEIDNLAGYIELPYGPVTAITSLVDADDTDSPATELDYTTTNGLSKLKTPQQANLLVTYEAGYQTTPEWVKNAILTEVAYRYMNRGDEEKKGVCHDAKIICSPYLTGWLQ